MYQKSEPNAPSMKAIVGTIYALIFMTTTPSTKVLEVYSLASQLDIDSLEHARAACGITCLWIVMRYIEPSYSQSLQELHDEQRINEWHFRSSDGLWLQPGSAYYARESGLKSMAINLNVMGGSEKDIQAMKATARLSDAEVGDYMELHQKLKHILDYKERFISTVKDFINQDVPVMISVGPGFGANGSNHRIVCSGYVDNDAIIVDPQDSTPNYRRESFTRLAECSTGNLLVVYKGKQ